MENKPICICDNCADQSGIEEFLTMGWTGVENCYLCNGKLDKENYNWIWLKQLADNKQKQSQN